MGLNKKHICAVIAILIAGCATPLTKEEVAKLRDDPPLHLYETATPGMSKMLGFSKVDEYGEYRYLRSAMVIDSHYQAVRDTFQMNADTVCKHHGGTIRSKDLVLPLGLKTKGKITTFNSSVCQVGDGMKFAYSLTTYMSEGKMRASHVLAQMKDGSIITSAEDGSKFAGVMYAMDYCVRDPSLFGFDSCLKLNIP